MPLSAGDFDQFFRDVHGHEPFSWQTDLLHTVHAERAWPDLLDVPTGGGKTALLDIALFALALDAGSPPGQRWAPRRTAMIVDRRIVVDQTARRADKIVTKLQRSDGGVVRAVAEALQSLSVSGHPAQSATLRGGLVRDVRWARWPDVPLLLSSTVDQVGSRLLHRGYGVTTSMRPVHAGLLGNDTLILLDEVHLSQAFAETLRAIRDRYQDAGEEAFPNRWTVVELSATPGVTTRRTTVVDPAAPPRRPSDELLAQRFAATKPVQLREVTAKRGVDERTALASAAVTEARALLDRVEHIRRLGVVVNRVATAQAVAAALTEHFPPARVLEHQTRIEVLTGRMRAVDRQEVIVNVTSQLASDTPRNPATDRVVLVATQCIEAGADLDLDALVTECASLDALRQRFGRVDRLGELSRNGTPAQGVVLVSRTDVVASAGDDPVYGPGLKNTWAWLGAQGNVDFGVRALEPPAPADMLPLLAPRDEAPLLRPGDLDRWVQTQPPPSPDPDPALWLHGLRSPARDVAVVWRADLSQVLLEEGRGREVVAVLPPTTSEAVTVPVHAVRRWLTDRTVAPVADVEGVTPPDDPDSASCSPFLVWRGDDSTVGTAPRDLGPGAVVVVPASYGGYSSGGWNPTSSEPVSDVAHEAHVRDRGAVLLRMNPDVWPAGTSRPPILNSSDDSDTGEDTAAAMEWMDRLLDSHPPSPSDKLPAAIAWTRQGKQRFTVSHPLGRGRGSVVVGRPLPRGLRVDTAAETVDSEPNTSSFTACAVSLDDHLEGVGALAFQLARCVGLSPALASDLELAGRLHDLGKADRRFQLWLHGGLAHRAAIASQPLAKSTLPASDGAARHRAQLLSGYPSGMRHEICSVAMIEEVPDLRARANDWDLVLHLVASHHGHARPFAPAVVDPDPGTVTHVVDGVTVSASSDHALARLDSGVADRFWAMVRRYGWFRLAWLEAILRLADHRRSEWEQRGEAVVR